MRFYQGLMTYKVGITLPNKYLQFIKETIIVQTLQRQHPKHLAHMSQFKQVVTLF